MPLGLKSACICAGKNHGLLLVIVDVVVVSAAAVVSVAGCAVSLHVCRVVDLSSTWRRRLATVKRVMVTPAVCPRLTVSPR